MFASEAFLGVRPAKRVTYCCIASPAGPYFASGVRPVKIWISTNYTRAAPGGTGAAKCGGNYAASLIAQQEAAEQGCDQVMFADAAEHRWLEELGGMNVYLVTRDHELITPELNGSILEGVTRDSILTLAAEFGLTPVERRIGIQELLDGHRRRPGDRALRLRHGGGDHPDRQPARCARRLRRRLRRDRRDDRRPAQEPAGHPVRPRRRTPTAGSAASSEPPGPAGAGLSVSHVYVGTRTVPRKFLGTAAENWVKRRASAGQIAESGPH